MSVIDDLRPVEALCLLDHLKREEMSLQNSVTAIIAYLHHEKYIEKDPSKNIRLRTIRSESSLRQYEKNTLEAIAYDDVRLMLDTIGDYRFGPDLAKKGFYTPETITRGWIFKRTKTIYRPTGKILEAAPELEELKKNPGPVMMYAFPSLGKSEFAKYSADYEEILTAYNLMLQTATMVASTTIMAPMPHF